MSEVINENASSTPAKRADRLKRLRNLANLTRSALAEKAKININTYTGYEVGRHGGLTKNGAEKILKVLAQEGVICTFEWLMHDVGAGPRVITDYKDITVAIETHITSFTSADKERESIIEELKFFCNRNEHAIDLIVNDDGMEPHYQMGDYIAGIKRFDQAIETAIGYDCIIQTTTGHTLFRHIKNKTADKRYTLICTNLKTQLDDVVLYKVEIISAAPVIWHRRRNPK